MKRLFTLCFFAFFAIQSYAQCLSSVSHSNVGSTYTFEMQFSGNIDSSLFANSTFSWTLDGVAITQNPYLTYSTTLSPGTYTICASFVNANCNNTQCVTITVPTTNPGGGSGSGGSLDSTIQIGNVTIGAWVLGQLDSIALDSTILSQLTNWQFASWNDSLLDLIFGGTNIVFDSNDLVPGDSSILVDLSGTLDSNIIAVLNSNGFGVISLTDFQNLWNTYLNTLAPGAFPSVQDFINSFNSQVSLRVSNQLSIEEVNVLNNAFFDTKSNTLYLGTDALKSVSVYSFDGRLIDAQRINGNQVGLNIDHGVFVLRFDNNQSMKIIK
ncbi:MAG: hypothetical protein N4A45_02580 [Flavobacteriales bacterium]|jgi:hypothetical protein|nr:hypothetical protein [Flavobacteriales bacterium]